MRVGIDLHPVDLRDPEEARWLRALIWPEHTLRAVMLAKAIEIARHEPPQLVQGDVLDVLPEKLEHASADAALCVFHSYMLNQFPTQAREALQAILLAHSHHQTVYRVSIEWLDGGPFPLLRLGVYDHGAQSDRLLARCDQHGAWIEWLADVP